VVRYSDASYVEDQDQWWFGGIHRGVFLYATEDCYLKDIKATTRGAGRISLGVTLGGNLPPSKSTGNVAMPLENSGAPFTIVYIPSPFPRITPAPSLWRGV
jgi:beta-galactosidase